MLKSLQIWLKPTTNLNIQEEVFEQLEIDIDRPAALGLKVVTMASAILNGAKKRPFLIAGGIAGCSVFFLVRSDDDAECFAKVSAKPKVPGSGSPYCKRGIARRNYEYCCCCLLLL